MDDTIVVAVRDVAMLLGSRLGEKEQKHWWEGLDRDWRICHNLWKGAEWGIVKRTRRQNVGRPFRTLRMKIWTLEMPE